MQLWELIINAFLSFTRQEIPHITSFPTSTTITPRTTRKTEPNESENSDKEQNQSRPGFLNPADIVTFHIGKEAEPFIVHKDFACFCSPVLNAAFNGEFIEAQTHTYRLEDVEIGPFRILVTWLYTRKVNPPLRDPQRARRPTSTTGSKDDSTSSMENDASQHSESQWDEIVNKQDRNEREERLHQIACGYQETDLVQSWVLGQRLLIPSFQNAVIERLMSRWTEQSYVCTNNLAYVYDNTSTGSPLRNLYVDWFAYQLQAFQRECEVDMCPKQMLGEIATVLCKATNIVYQMDTDGVRRPSRDELGKLQYTCVREWRDYRVPENKEPPKEQAAKLI